MPLTRGQEEQPKTGSLKDEIIQRIKQQEQRDRETAVGGPVAARPSQRGWRRSFFAPSIASMAIYCRQLATLIDVGIPLLRALQILAQRTSHPKLRRVSGDLARRVEEGQPLSTAMLAHPNVFSPMFVSVVRTGEAGGILDESMRRLADLLERRAEIRRRVVGAFIYPLITLIIEIAVMIVILVYALPKLMAAYPRQEDLPAITRGLLAFSAWFIAYWWLVLLIVLGIIILFYVMMSIRSTRYMMQKTVLYLPIFGNVNRKINVARFSRTLGNLTAAGIPLIDALGITAETADNEVVEQTLYRVQRNVETGGKMEEPMRKEPVFDPVVVDMVMVGDEAGALDTMLLKIADTYDSEVDHTLKTMTAILEPLLIVLLGIAVAFLAVAVFVPYVSLVRSPLLMPE